VHVHVQSESFEMSQTSAEVNGMRLILPFDRCLYYEHGRRGTKCCASVVQVCSSYPAQLIQHCTACALASALQD